MTVAVQSPSSNSSSKDWRKIASIWSVRRAGGPIIFLIVTIAFVVQTELAQAVQKTYHKPYFLLYLTHSGYAFLLPLHLLILKFFEPSISVFERLTWIKELVIFQFNYQLQSQSQNHPELRSSVESQNSDLQPLLSSSCASPKQRFPLWWFIKRCIQLTLFLTLPAMCWYASVPLADMTSITAVFNTHSCFTYVFSVWFLESENFEIGKTVGVLGSLIGALMISWSEPSTSDLEHIDLPSHRLQASQVDGQLRWLGISLVFLGSTVYALYEVWYKKFIALPDSRLFDGSSSGSFLSPKAVSGLPGLEEVILDQQNYHGTEIHAPAQSITVVEEVGKKNTEESHKLLKEQSRNLKGNEIRLIYSNFITTMVGLVTMSILWLPIPILNQIGFEKFEPIQDWNTAGMILGIVVMGVTFNGGFMILLGLWGPVISSVGSLCSLVLIAIVDKIVMIYSGNHRNGFFEFDFLSFFGSFFILTGFSILIHVEKQKMNKSICNL